MSTQSHARHNRHYEKHRGRNRLSHPNARAQRMARPMAALQRRWGPPALIIILAVIVLICDPAVVLWVLGAVVVAFAGLSFWRRHQARAGT